MKGGAAESRVRKFGGEKKKVLKIETRSDRQKKKMERERERICGKRGCLCLGVRFSAGGGLREIMEGRMEG